MMFYFIFIAVVLFELVVCSLETGIFYKIGKLESVIGRENTGLFDKGLVEYESRARLKR